MIMFENLFKEMDFSNMDFKNMDSEESLEEKRKIFEEMVNGKFLREFDHQGRFLVTSILLEEIIRRVKPIDKLTFNELRILIEEVVHRLALAMRINPFRKDYERQVLETLELERAIRDYKASIPAIFEDCLFKDPLWEELDLIDGDILAEVIYSMLKKYYNK